MTRLVHGRIIVEQTIDTRFSDDVGDGAALTATRDAPWVGAETAWRNSFLPPPSDSADAQPSLVYGGTTIDETAETITEEEFETILSSLAPPPVPELRPWSALSRGATSALKRFSYVSVAVVVMILGWALVDTHGASDTRGAVKITPGMDIDFKSSVFTGDLTFYDDVKQEGETLFDEDISSGADDAESETVDTGNIMVSIPEHDVYFPGTLKINALQCRVPSEGNTANPCRDARDSNKTAVEFIEETKIGEDILGK